jgi:hypothetical protein
MDNIVSVLKILAGILLAVLSLFAAIQLVETIWLIIQNGEEVQADPSLWVGKAVGGITMFGLFAFLSFKLFTSGSSDKA